MASADLELVKDWVNLEITPQLYEQIRSLWAYHCDRENVWDIPALLTTLTDDCEYHVVNLRKKYHGHAGAQQFYQEISVAFADIMWVPEVLVIGPQGVFDVVVLNGKQLGDWAGMKATGKSTSVRLFVWFEWDMQKSKFKGERIYFQLVTPESSLLPDELPKADDAHAILTNLQGKER